MQHEKIKGLRGWRGYDIVSPGLLLSNRTVIMPGDDTPAICNKGQEACREVPGEDCTCGFYSWRTMELLAESYYSGHGVICEVAPWGRTAIHKLGIRSRHVAVTAIWVHNEGLLWTRELEAYGVPVRPIAELEGFTETVERKFKDSESRHAARAVSSDELEATLGNPALGAAERAAAGRKLVSRLASKVHNGRRALDNARLELARREVELDNNIEVLAASRAEIARLKGRC